MLGGLLAGHSLSYRLALPDAEHRAQALHESGHGYLSYAPLALTACLALACLGLLLRAAAAGRDRPGSRVRAWPFGALAPLAFMLQEHLERLLAAGEWPLAASLQPTFLLGLLLQAPFATLAYVLARALIAVADTLGRVFAASRRKPAREAARVPLPSSPIERRRLSPLVLGGAERAPPVIALG